MWKPQPNISQPHHRRKTRGIPNWIKWAFYLAAWGGVVVAVIVRKPDDLLTAPGFPVGLLGVLFLIGAEQATVAVWFGGLGAVVAGWFLYAFLSVTMMRTKKTWVFSMIYVGFCVLLALNLAGCRKIMETVAGIH
jgi:hypothetical protein